MRHLLLTCLLVVACGDRVTDDADASDTSGSDATGTGSGASGTGGSEVGAGGQGGEAPVTTSMMIGSPGGTLTTPEGVVLVIPEGALAEDTLISITRVAAIPGVLSDVFELQPDGIELLLPAALTIPYDPAALGGTLPSQLAIGWADGGEFTGAGWTLTSDGTATATAYITHFSAWAVVPAAPSGCQISYSCMKQCSGVDVPDLCCNEGRSWCTSLLTTSFPHYVACYANCLGTSQISNFGNSACMSGCCTAQGGSVTNPGTCYKANGSLGEQQAVLSCARDCFDAPDTNTICDTGQVQDQCGWNELNTPDMGSECVTNGSINSQVLATTLRGVLDQLWGVGPVVHVTGGSLSATTIDVQLSCASANPATGTMTGTWDGTKYTGAWTFGTGNGTFQIAPRWPLN